MAAKLTNGNSGGSAVAASAVALAPSFEDLVEAYFAVRHAPNHAEKVALKQEFQRVEESFAKAAGPIAHQWFGPRRRTAVVLTSAGELLITYPLDDAAVAEICFTALGIQSEAKQHAKPEVRATCGSLLYAAVTSVLQQAEPAGPKVSKTMKKLVLAQLEQARQSYVVPEERRARMVYSAGMVGGAVVVFLISLAVLLVMPALIGDLVAKQQVRVVTEMFAACLNAGGAGALLSVMTRMSSGSLTIRYKEGNRTLFLVGGFRPVIGGVSGVAVYTLYKAQLLPLQLPPGGSEFFTFGALAFLSGFSERLAQDALMQTTRKAFGSK